MAHALLLPAPVLTGTSRERSEHSENPRVGPGDLQLAGSLTSPSSSTKAGTFLPGCLALIAPALKPPVPTGPRAGIFRHCMRLWRAPVTNTFCLDLHVLLCRALGLGCSVCSQQDCVSWRGRQGWESLTGCLH